MSKYSLQTKFDHLAVKYHPHRDYVDGDGT